MSWFFFLAVLFVTLPPFFLCFRFPRPFLPNTLTLSFLLAVSFFGVGLLVIVFTALQILSLLVLDVEFSECLFWNGYTLVFFCGLFLVEHTARSCTFTQSWFWEVYLSISEFRCGCLYVFHFVGLRLFQLRVRSARWADSPRASSQVNGLSSLEFKTRSGLTVRVHLRRSTVFPASSSKLEVGLQCACTFAGQRQVQPALRYFFTFAITEDVYSEATIVWKQFHRVYDHQNLKLNIHFKITGTETSLNPGGQQGICFPVSLTGKMR